MAKKIIVILGPTASGKSEMAVMLAKKFNAEIISADSRQIYKGMDIGTDKVPRDKNKKLYFYKGVLHHLLDIVLPKRKFSVAQYKKLAIKTINKILKENKIPILCGGTGFYIQAVIDGIVIPEVKPDWQLRKRLEKKSIERLYNMLKKMDPKRAKEIDKKNPRRLIRAIEIVLKTKKPISPFKTNPLPYPVLKFGIKKSSSELEKKIKKRFSKWLRQGLIKEVENLKKSGLSWKKIEAFGIHYRIISHYLQKKLDYETMTENSIREIKNYSRRQMTWFKKDKRINWIKNYRQAEKLTKKFLSQ